MSTYAITGCSGYIGTQMTRRLLDADPANRVIGFDVRPPRFSDPRLEFHDLDVRDPRIAEKLAGRGVRSLLHFAFILDPLYDEKEMTDIDLGGTRVVLDAVKKNGIQHLLATSSTSAYGALPDNPVPLREQDPVRARPEFVYAHDKKLMDEMLRDFARANPEVKVCIVRPCIVLGPTVSNYIAANMLRQPVATLIDGADPVFQFVHEDDLSELIYRCIEREAAGVFNAVGEGLVTTRELAAIQRKRTVKVPARVVAGLLWGVKKLRLLDYQLPPGVIDFYRYPWVASGDKAKAELAFTPRHTSRECFEIILARKDQILEAFTRQMKARGKR
jgi:UDP-glucose 4-epimerase